MTEVGQETVDFAALVGRAAEESYVALKDLVEISKSSESLSDSEKKIMILKYIVKTQQRMLRLDVLAKWCQQVFLFTIYHSPPFAVSGFVWICMHNVVAHD